MLIKYVFQLCDQKKSYIIIKTSLDNACVTLKVVVTLKWSHLYFMIQFCCFSIFPNAYFERNFKFQTLLDNLHKPLLENCNRKYKLNDFKKFTKYHDFTSALNIFFNS